MQQLQHKYGPWALVTGASSGIGAEFSRQLAANGFNLVLAARRIERLNQLAAELQTQCHIQTRTVQIDLSDPDFLPLLRNHISDIEIGLLVNNAGFSIAENLLESTLECELQMLHVNCRAPLMLAHEIVPHMVTRRRGGVIFVSSMTGLIPSPPWSHYAATKIYLKQLAECLSEEWSPHGIDVLAFCPGAVATEFQQVAGADYGSAGILARFATHEMPAGVVVRSALHSLGKKVVLIPGWHNRILRFLHALTPRQLAIHITAAILNQVKQK